MKKNPDRIAEQAAEYFARRNGAALSERKARDAWLTEDPRNTRAYEDFQRLWESVGDLASDSELQALKAADLAATRRQRMFRPQRMFAIAATLLLFVGTGYLVTRYTQLPEAVAYSTALGERRTATMPDGTKIVLNTDSVVEVRYSKGRRAVDLKQGEAQFEVAHDAKRPFVVSAGRDTVTALGTRFQVRSDMGSTVVTLLDGSVAIAREGERYILKPNERAVLSARTGIAISSIDPVLASSWLDGWLRFRGAPLAEVIVDANRYSTRKLKLGDPRLADVKLSGNFHVGDNESIAAAVQLILPVHAEEHASEIVLQAR